MTKTVKSQNVKELYNGKNVPTLCSKPQIQLAKYTKMWHNTYKPFGFECIDVRYGGMIARITTAIERIDSYLKGEISNLEELEATRLRHEVEGTNRYFGIYTASSIR